MSKFKVGDYVTNINDDLHVIIFENGDLSKSTILTDRNKKVRYMRNTGKWGHN